MTSRILTGLIWVAGIAAASICAVHGNWFWFGAALTLTALLTPLFVRKSLT